jgi:hypothetical protein
MKFLINLLAMGGLMTCYLLNNTLMLTQQNQQNVASPLKASIRDLVRLHQYYNPSDEVLWAYFNARVLLDQPIEVDEFIVQSVMSDDLYSQIPTPAVG